MTSALPMPDCDRPALTRAGSTTLLGRIANFVPAAACVFAAAGMAVAYFIHPQGVPPSLMRVQLAIVVVATLAVLISAVLESKRSHAAMVANGAVLQAMMAAFPFPLFALGPARDVHACNQAALKTFRCGIGTCGPYCNSPLAPCAFVREQPLSGANHCVDGTAVAWSRSDGTNFDFELYARPLSAINGGDLGHLAILQDVTQRRRAEMGMEAAAAEWRQTFDALNSIVLIIDEQQRLRRVNRSAQRALGLPFQQIIDRPLSDFADSEPFRTVNHLFCSGATMSDGKLSEIYDKGADRTWAVSVNSVNLPGGGVHRIVLVRETTELVQLRDSLRATEALSELGALVGGVAHQVRNPLFTISATLDTLDAVCTPSEQHQVFLAVLRQQVQRLDGVMRDLLRFGRPQNLILKDGSVVAVLQDVLEACRLVAEQRQVKVCLSSATAINDRLPMDSGKLFGAFHNVIENAVQHSPAGGTVRVHVESQEHGILCRVFDAGSGFLDLNRVFEPFYTRRPGGTGLGLPIAKRVIEQHGGYIQAANHPGGGGEVSVFLPIHASEAVDAAAPAAC